MKITLQKVESIRQALGKLPPAMNVEFKMSRSALVKALAPQIFALRRRGYTLNDIAAALSREGVQLAPGTLKNCLRVLRREQRTAREPEGEEAARGADPTAEVAAAHVEGGARSERSGSDAAGLV